MYLVVSTNKYQQSLLVAWVPSSSIYMVGDEIEKTRAILLLGRDVLLGSQLYLALSRFSKEVLPLQTQLNFSM